MYRQSLRIASSSLAKAVPRTLPGRRCISTAPPHKLSRSFRSSAVRWGLAGALVYYYNTSTVFAEEPAYTIHAPPQTQRETEIYPSIEAIAAERKSQSSSLTPSSASHSESVAAPDAENVAPGSPGELEEEAGQQGAFNEETGEINWDCPCLGGMANGTCGEQFRAAFSCFVYSKEEPKGVDCIEHFKTMQNCFREHPEEYGSELDDEDGEAPHMHAEGEELQAATSQRSSGHDQSDGSDPAAHQGDDSKHSSIPEYGTPNVKPQADTGATSKPSPAPTMADVGDFHHGKAEKVVVQRDAAPTSDDVIAGRNERARAATEQVQRDFSEPTSESKSVVPKAAHDGR
ncbi:hypothetical protein LTR62_004366 [Meristemomyces frigidus]|uniref:Mitochondrial intermembrane space import and assembly protein 40 n=1 Tax=Meristemomyces frigidus TaxID=1508187 RepID=A0AAN7TI12_9PEZI|nr:hypothetical protein LTR62_004366 [Meristemomyces frigidus]